MTEADRALLLAMAAWADPGGSSAANGGNGAGEADFILRLGDWLDPSLVQRLAEDRDRDSPDGDARDPIPGFRSAAKDARDHGSG